MPLGWKFGSAGLEPYGQDRFRNELGRNIQQRMAAVDPVTIGVTS